MTAFRRFLPAAIALLLATGVSAQMSDHFSNAQLMERARHLRELAAAGDGSASETLATYPRHHTMLAFRSKSGGGELHQHYADLFYILDGKATLLTGGKVDDQETTGPGEIRGSGVSGGHEQALKAGDVVHIPAGMPHQMVLAAGDTVTYFVVKMQESE
ncbi:MAG TPA: cupin domain-containing protein [Terracidiphilus sp.]